MVFSRVTELCNHHHVNLRLFSSPQKETLYSFNSRRPHRPSLCDDYIPDAVDLPYQPLGNH